VKFPVLLVVAANCLWLGIMHQKTEVEAWISRHVELYCITSITRIYNYLPDAGKSTQIAGGGEDSIPSGGT